MSFCLTLKLPLLLFLESPAIFFSPVYAFTHSGCSLFSATLIICLGQRGATWDMWDPLSSWEHLKDCIRNEVTPEMQKVVAVLQDAFWCRLSLVAAVSACRAGLDKDIKEAFKDCKVEGKRSFWHLVSIPFSQDSFSVLMEDCSFLILHK